MAVAAGNQTPAAHFTFSPEHPQLGETVTFNASSSQDPDGTIVEYTWDFGDGTTGEGKIVNHTYANMQLTPNGQPWATVTLTVTDNEGESEKAVHHPSSNMGQDVSRVYQNLTSAYTKSKAFKT